jgi:hypothetical protein
MFSKSVSVAVTVLALAAVSRQAAAACISPTGSKEQIGKKTVFDVGGDTFGSSLKVRGGMWNAADANAAVAAAEAFARSLGVTLNLDNAPADLVQVYGDATAYLDFFGKRITLLELEARAKRESGSFSRKFTIEVAGIDLYSGSNNLTTTMKTIGPFEMPFYTIGTSYSGVYAQGTILGAIGMNARAVASASDGLEVEGRSWAALVLEGSAGLSVGGAGVGLFANVDLIEVGLNYHNRLGLTSGSTYDFLNTYDARTLDGRVALKASALGGSVTLWEDAWSGKTIATKVLYDVNGCVQ